MDYFIIINTTLSLFI